MGYRNLQQCVDDLERSGRLVRLDEEVDPRLEVAEIHRRVFQSGGPAVLYTNVKCCSFPLVSNLFGTLDRALFLFRDTLPRVRKLIELKVDPGRLAQTPVRYLTAPLSAWHMLPRRVRRGPAAAQETTLSRLPQVVGWPGDGGAFITLPQVYSEDVDRPGLAHSNLGMYRIQLSGNEYRPEEEVGLHYQIHRGIGVHQSRAIRAGKPFPVNVFVGGTPAMTLAAVMPLPEGMSELGFAGALAGSRIPMLYGRSMLPFYAEADFTLCGTVLPDRLAPEGPFGDHLGYYSLAHPFPVLRVEKVFHRRGAIWPFTVVGRPPQEDTAFGQLIHEITGPVIPTVVHGVREVHAVDAAGVHPLLLAIGSERYMPFYEITEPQELLTQACALLGQGQLSLAKYLMIVAEHDAPTLNLHDIPSFLAHLLARIDFTRDLHFHTRTTIDTLDYSGGGLNRGSKLVLAAVGKPIRELPRVLPLGCELPAGFCEPRVCLPGVLAVQSPPHSGADDQVLTRFCRHFQPGSPLDRWPLVVLVDDSKFAAHTLNNFLWVVFTRSNPASDVDGVGAFIEQKHWGCRASLVIDARVKPHHAPTLEEDPAVSARVDALAARGGPLAKWL